MKKISIFLIILLTAAAAAVPAEAVLYGDYDLNLSAFAGEDDYTSALNPGNIAGLSDISLTHTLTVKLAAGDEFTSLEVWAGLEQQFDPLTGTLSDVLNSLNLQRAGISWYMGDNFKFKLGRHSMLTGYGYGWNPIDFANPLKDPTDPNADLSGVDVFLIHLFPDSEINLKVYGAVDLSSGGISYTDINPGAELTMLLPFGEIKLTGLYDWDETAGEDDKVTAAGAGVYLDIAGIGLYGEGAVLEGSRTLFADSENNSLSRKTEILFNALGGFEYTFESGLTAAAEYFYNGEGCDNAEMQSYADALGTAALSADTAAFTALASEFRPGSYSKHNVLLNLVFPIYELNIDLTGTVLFAADSGSLTVLPMITWWASGGLSLEAGWAGIFDLYGLEGSEADLSPADHTITLSGSYSF